MLSYVIDDFWSLRCKTNFYVNGQWSAILFTELIVIYCYTDVYLSNFSRYICNFWQCYNVTVAPSCIHIFSWRMIPNTPICNFPTSNFAWSKFGQNLMFLLIFHSNFQLILPFWYCIFKIRNVSVYIICSRTLCSAPLSSHCPKTCRWINKWLKSALRWQPVQGVAHHLPTTCLRIDDARKKGSLLFDLRCWAISGCVCVCWLGGGGGGGAGGARLCLPYYSVYTLWWDKQLIYKWCKTWCASREVGWSTILHTLRRIVPKPLWQNMDEWKQRKRDCLRYLLPLIFIFTVCL